MSIKERILHMALFEAIALMIFVPLAMFIAQEDATTMLGMSIILATIAMGWNFIYNWIFDILFGHERIKRGVILRIFHASCFELGMVIASFPIMMMILQKDFLTILWMDIGTVTFFFIYAILFNWAYDIIRHRYMQTKQTTSA